MAFISVIKYEGDNSTFLWKCPEEDFNTASQLVVHQSQEAVFFRDGRALAVFGAGRYALNTDNLPFLRGLIGLFTGGVSPFHCEVYFINRTTQMAIPWGTGSRIQFLEPTYGFPVTLGASGELALSVADSRLLLTRLVGAEHVLTQSELTRFFRSLLVPRVKTYLAQTIRANSLSIFELDACLDDFSEELRAQLAPDFEEYGVSLDEFRILNLAKPDGEAQYERFKELHFRQYADLADAKLRQQVEMIEQQTAAQCILTEAQAMKEKRRLEGDTYQQERGFDVAEKAAEAAPVPRTGSARFCSACGVRLSPGDRFCGNCGAACAEPGTCPKCGYPFVNAGRFCPNCGAERER